MILGADLLVATNRALIPWSDIAALGAEVIQQGPEPADIGNP